MRITKNVKKILSAGAIIFIVGSLCSFSANWQIRKGEKLTYYVAFNSFLTGDIRGGKATLSVSPNTMKFRGYNVYHALLTGETIGMVEWFYTVNNFYESYIDSSTQNPVMFIQKIKENKYSRNDTVTFDQAGNSATINRKRVKAFDNTQDFVSMLYYVRKLDFSSMKEGDVFLLPLLTERSVINSKVVFKGKQTIKTKYGTTECFALKPQVETGKIFKDEYPATIWISADSKRIPILAEAKMKVGKIKLELVKAE